MTEPPTPFRPKPLAREALDVPVQPHWRHTSPEDEKRFHEQAISEHRKFAAFHPRMRRRLARYVAYGVVGYVAFGWLFILHPPLLVFALLGAVAGSAVALLRTGDFTTGLVLGGTIFVAMSATRHPGFLQFLMTACACLLFGSVGILVGRGEEMKRLDGTE